MTSLNVCSICGKLLGMGDMDSLCPECYRDWNEDDDGHDWDYDYLSPNAREQFESQWPSMPDLDGVDLFADFEITGSE